MRKSSARPARVLLVGALLAAAGTASVLPFPQAMSRSWAQPAAEAGRPVPSGAVIVRAVPGKADDVAAAVTKAGGRVTRELPIIDGFAATLPAAAAAALAADPDVVAVTPDGTGHVMAVDPVLGYDVTYDTGSLSAVAQMIGATSAYYSGITGKGVDVAVIDTGVAPVTGLTSGNVINGPDLSFDSIDPGLRYKDAFGHGTHMASIIAGRDKVLPAAEYATTTSFHGIAPDARVISLKVGAADGSADVSQVIAAIDWVTQHAQDPGMNIRVLNLSYGTDSKQDYRIDPLAYAAEAAWRKGVLVVVAGGNDGTSNVDLASPASDPNLLAVGATDTVNTLSIYDDLIPAFSNRGTSTRHVDVIAPGVHLLGLRVPGGVVDTAYPGARVGTRFFRGSGTSQATAVVSGAAALLFQKYPDLTPQQAKAFFLFGGISITGMTPTNGGNGVVYLPNLFFAGGSPYYRAQAAAYKPTYGTGLGSLEAARGSQHVSWDGVDLTGEQDIFGKPFVPAVWAPKALAGNAWGTDGSWNGTVWSGTAFDGSGNWLASRWAGSSWAGKLWTASRWAASRWAGEAWVASRWAGEGWSASRWANAGWSSASWS